MRSATSCGLSWGSCCCGAQAVRQVGVQLPGHTAAPHHKQQLAIHGCFSSFLRTCAARHPPTRTPNIGVCPAAGSSTLVSLASVRPAVLLAAAGASANGDDIEEASLLALAPDPAAAADAFNAAAEEASAAFKGKLAQRYFEAAAQAEAAAEAAADGSTDDGAAACDG